MDPKRLALPTLLVGTLATNVALLTRDSAPPPAEDVAEGLSRAVQEVSGKLTPAVVSVTSIGDGRLVARGSGVLVREDGIIVTNQHVIQGGEEVWVSMLDGQRLRAKVRGFDGETDLAVLDLDARGRRFPTAPLSPDAPPEIGSWVLAIGNPLGLDHTVTFGIVSARGRSGLGIATYEDFLQTDAAINAGNSGGPLVNLEGEVVGINTAKEMLLSGNQGLGFAIPAYMVSEVVDEILEKGHVERGWFGIRVTDLSPRQVSALGLRRGNRVRVRQVLPDSPAEDAGLLEGDVLLAIGGTEIHDSRGVLDSIAKLTPGSKVLVDLWREDEAQVVMVDVGERVPVR